MNKKTFLSLFGAVFTAVLGMGVVAPLIPVYAENMGAAGFWLGIMYSGFGLSRAIFMPIMGRFSDRRGRKIFMALGLVAYAIISLAYVLASNVYQLTTVRFLHGAASSMVIPIAQAYIGDLIPPGKEGFYMNLFTMSIILGIGSGPLLGGTLADTFFLSAGFYAMAALTSLALAFLLFFVPDTGAHLQQQARAPLRRIIRDKKVIAVSTYLASRGFYQQGLMAFLPILMVSSMETSIASAGLLLSSFMLTAGLSQALFGRLADRFSKARLIVIGSVTTPPLLFLVSWGSTMAMLLAVLIPMALLGALGRASVMALNVELGNKHRGMGSVMGISRSAMNMGMVIGPMLFGYAMDHFGVGAVFQIGAGVAFVAIVPIIYFLYK